MKQKVTIFWLGFALSMFLTSYYCNSKSKEPENSTHIEVQNQKKTIPFIEQNCVKYVTLNINGLEIVAMFDTGCGYPIYFSQNDYKKLVNAKIIQENQFTDQSFGHVATGERICHWHFKIPKLKIGTMTFENQDAVFSENGVMTMIGNPFMNQFKKYAIDNENHYIIINN